MITVRFIHDNSGNVIFGYTYSLMDIAMISSCCSTLKSIYAEVLVSGGLISKFLTLSQIFQKSCQITYLSTIHLKERLINSKMKVQPNFKKHLFFSGMEISFFQGCKSLRGCKRLFCFGDVNVFFASGM